tara:strand:+ start:268 stop:603 length:336 start_codon:yes stop_codon:yes gene_type:complete
MKTTAADMAAILAADPAIKATAESMAKDDNTMRAAEGIDCCLCDIASGDHERQREYLKYAISADSSARHLSLLFMSATVGHQVLLMLARAIKEQHEALDDELTNDPNSLGY